MGTCHPCRNNYYCDNAADTEIDENLHRKIENDRQKTVFEI